MYYGTLHRQAGCWSSFYAKATGKTGVLPTEGQEWHFFRDCDPTASDVYLDGTVERVRVRGPRGKWRVFTTELFGVRRQYRFEINRED